MGNEINSTWTPKTEEWWQSRIDTCPTFASRHLLTGLRDVLKYDLRSREGKRTDAQSRLRIATATDKELRDLAELKVILLKDKAVTVEDELEVLIQTRARINREGIKRSELER